MSLIGKNIKKIRSVKEISQQSFAELFGLSRTSVGSYEEGRAEPKIETIIQIANYFGVSIDLLLLKEITVNDLYGFDIFKIKENKQQQSEVKQINDGFPFVSLKDRKSYLLNLKDKKYCDSLEKISIPIYLNLNVKAFEHEGNSMYDGSNGFFNGDILIGSPIKIDQVKRLEENTPYIYITKTDIKCGVFKSISNHKIQFNFLNSSKMNDFVNLSELEELFLVIGCFSTKLYKFNTTKNRIDKLEEQMKYVFKKLDDFG